MQMMARVNAPRPSALGAHSACHVAHSQGAHRPGNGQPASKPFDHEQVIAAYGFQKLQ